MKKTTYKIAESLSLALNPFFMLSLVFLIALFRTEMSIEAQTRWLAVVILCNFILPFWWIHYLDNRGFVLDDKLSNTKLHRKRLIALIPIIVVVMAEIAVMAIHNIYQPLFAVFISVLGVAIIGGWVSYFWKISAHMLGLSAAISFLIFLVGPWAYWSIIAVPIVAWARLILHRHTPWQLILGTLVPPIIILLIFNWFGLIKLI